MIPNKKYQISKVMESTVVCVENMFEKKPMAVGYTYLMLRRPLTVTS